MSASGERSGFQLGMHLTPIGDGILLLEPGDALDPGASDEPLMAVLEELTRRRCSRLIYDLKNAVVIDQLYYDWLCRLAAGCRVCGAQMVAVNIPPPAAYALSLRLAEDPPFRCALNVDRARS